MADGSIWPDFLTNMFGGGGGGDSPGPSSGLTPDQQNMLQNQGYYMRPDAVAPTGSSFQQPVGYSNLSPDQIQAVNAQGYYTGTPGGSSSSGGSDLWNKLKANVGQDSLSDVQKGLPGAPAPRQNLAPAPSTPYHIPVQNPYHTQYQPPVLGGTSAPGGWKEALLRFQRGY